MSRGYMSRGVHICCFVFLWPYLALGSIKSFSLVSIAPESPYSKSAWCQSATLGEIEIFTS